MHVDTFREIPTTDPHNFVRVLCKSGRPGPRYEAEMYARHDNGDVCYLMAAMPDGVSSYATEEELIAGVSEWFDTMRGYDSDWPQLISY